jgi:hypothetical protein
MSTCASAPCAPVLQPLPLPLPLPLLLLLLLLLPGTYNDQIRDNNRTQCAPCPGGSTGTVEGASSKDSCNRKWAQAQQTAAHTCGRYGLSASARGACNKLKTLLLLGGVGWIACPFDTPPNMLCTCAEHSCGW